MNIFSYNFQSVKNLSGTLRKLSQIDSLLNQTEITILQRNLQVLMAEIYKNVNYIAPPVMSSLFEIRENAHNTRYF